MSTNVFILCIMHNGIRCSYMLTMFSYIKKTIVNFLNIRLPYDDNSTLMIDLFVLYLVGEQISYIVLFGCSVTS